MDLPELKRKTIAELIEMAHSFRIDGTGQMRRQELIFAILEEQSSRRGEITAQGVIEVLQDGFGFLRAPDHNYLPGVDDIYVSPSQIRRFGLRTGDTVGGQIRPPKESERYFALLKVYRVNGQEPDRQRTKILFDNLTPLYPDERLRLEDPKGSLSTRMLDLLCPMGKGQRCLLVAPPRTGKTALLQKLARGVEENHPEVHLIVLLIDERPEEVTEMRRALKGEVISSTFDETPARHVQVAEIVIEKAKRLAENRQDVVILLDSLTRLTHAYNAVVPPSGKALVDGLDVAALHKPKRFFGAARNIEEGGSITIVATVLTDTGSRADEAIREEFQGTSNAELHLDRLLADNREYPCIDLERSHTDRSERLQSKRELQAARALRDSLRDLDTVAALQSAREHFDETDDNEQLVARLAHG